jgi:hypothetical protein
MATVVALKVLVSMMSAPASLEIDVPVRETLATIIRLLQLVGLDHGAHGAIQNQDAFGEQLLELGGAVAGHEKA